MAQLRLPLPEAREPRSKFIRRCLLDPEARWKHPHPAARQRACEARWREIQAKRREKQRHGFSLPVPAPGETLSTFAGRAMVSPALAHLSEEARCEAIAQEWYSKPRRPARFLPGHVVGLAVPLAVEYYDPEDDVFRQLGPEAFVDTLDDGHEIVATLRHDDGKRLGSTRWGNLRVFNDADGIRFKLWLPDNIAGQKALDLLTDEDDCRCSCRFSFSPDDETKWTYHGLDKRTIVRRARLNEVCLTPDPTFVSTWAHWHPD